MKYIVTIVAVLLVLAVAAPAADVTGKWKAEMKGRDGNVRESVFDFKVDGSKLTGTVTGARGGAVEITDGAIEGDNLSFTVVRKFREREFQQQYKGVVKGDEIHFNVSFGEREFPVVAKRQ